MSDAPVSTEPAPDPALVPGGAAPRWRSRVRVGSALALVVVIVVVVVAIVVVAGGGGAGVTPPADGAASIVPADALAYVNVSLDRRRPAVNQALAVAARLPDFPLAAAAAISRLSAILGGGRAVDYATQIKPWLGNEAALALLNTPTSTAGSLIILAVTDRTRARSFVRSAGAVSRGSDRGISLLAYPSGSELAFVGGYLVLGQDASVRAAIEVSAGVVPSLQSASVYRRATANEPAGRELDAYASAAGVRRVLAPQGGVIGALGDLLYQPALEGVSIALTPTTGGARIAVHSALDPTLARLSRPSTRPFTPTLQNVIPTGSILMLDVSGLDRVAPQVLNAGATAGVAGGIGPLLSRLGTALTAEGVNVRSIDAIFDGETAVAIVPHAQSPSLVIVARTADQAAVQTELAQLEIPLAQLFQSTSGSRTVPEFNDRQIGSVTAHQLPLANGLQLDYAVAHGLVMISTSLAGITEVIERSHPLASDPAFRFALGDRPHSVTGLVYVDFGALLTLGEQTGITNSARFRALRSDLEKIQAIGLSSTRAQGESSAQLSIRIP